MKKSFFNKSITRVVMSLGAVGVLTMAPMHSALADSSVRAYGSNTDELADRLYNMAEKKCKSQKKKVGPGTVRFVKLEKNGPNKGLYEVKVKFTCVK